MVSEVGLGRTLVFFWTVGSLVVQIISSGSKKGESMEEFAERVRWMVVRAFPSLGRAGVELYSVEFFLKGLGNKRTSLSVLDKAPDSIGKAVDWAKNFEANVSWVAEDSTGKGCGRDDGRGTSIQVGGRK